MKSRLKSARTCNPAPKRKSLIESLESRTLLSVVSVGSARIAAGEGSDGLSIAADAAGDYVVAWVQVTGSDALHTQRAVFARAFDAQGLALTNALEVDTGHSGNTGDVKVVVDAAGHCIIQWNDGAMFAQRYTLSSSSLTAVGSNLPITFPSTLTTTFNGISIVDSSGDFVVVSGEQTGIDAQAINFTTGASSGVVHVSDSTSNRTEVAANTQGNVVVAWGNTAGVIPNLTTHIYERRLSYSSASGTLSLVDSRDVELLAGLVATPQDFGLAMDASGNFAVADAGSVPVYAQQFDQSTDTLSAPFTAVGSVIVTHVAIAYDAAGHLLVTYAANDPTHTPAVFARRFDAPGRPDSANGFQVGNLAVNSLVLTNSLDFAVTGYSSTNFLVTYEGPAGGATQNLYTQELTANPATVSGVATGSDVAITPGQVIPAAQSSLIVRFSDDVVTSGAASVSNINNYALTQNGADISSTISSVSYGYNASSDSFEATLHLSAPLTAGTFVLTVHPTIGGGPTSPFSINFDTPSIPAVAISGPVVMNAGQSSETITVIYSDNFASIDPSTITPSNIQVWSPLGSPLMVTSTEGRGNSSSITGTYTVAAPTGTFTANDDGTYIIAIAANSVVNALGTGNLAATGSFSVALPVPTLSAVVFAPDVTTVGQSSETVSVIYTDAAAMVDSATLAARNITVTSPTGAMLPITYAGATQGGNSIEADYTVTAPNGTFSNADIGTYTVTVVNGSVMDLNTNPVAQTSGSFLFNPFEDPHFGPFAAAGSTQAGNLGVTFAAQDVLSEPNGNILIIGQKGDPNAGTAQGMLEQLTPDGVPDTTFGAAGIVTTPLGDNDQFFSAALQSDGRIVAVGSQGGAFLAARYDTDGSIDTSFNTTGFATAGFGADGSGTAYSVAIQSNGAVVLAGGTSTGLLAIARFTTSGAPDSTFNPNGADDASLPPGGERTIATDGAASYFSQILIDAQGRIVGGGADGTSVIALRLNPDGSTDATFGASGIVTLSQLAAQDANHATNAQDIAIQPGGDILVSGQAADGGLGAARLTPLGQLDTPFGTNGLVTATFGGANESADSIVVNPATGEFMLIGTTTASNATQTVVAAFNADGSVDTNFGQSNTGVTTLPSVSSSAGAQTHAFHPQNADFAFGRLQADGRLIVGASNPSRSSFRRIKVVGIKGATPIPIGSTVHTRVAPFTLPNGTIVAISLQGGSGTIAMEENKVDLNITRGNPAVTIRTKGGANTFTLASMTLRGNLRSLMAPTATLTGTLSIPGNAGAMRLASITGTLRTGGSIASLTAGSVSGSVSCGNILTRASFGIITGTVTALTLRNFSAATLSDAIILAGTRLGTTASAGMNATPTTYGPGMIQSLMVKGSVASSLIAAGAAPSSDGSIGTGADMLAGPGSLIRSMVIHGGVDSTSRFEAGTFPRTVHVPKPLAPTSDPLHRFVVLS